MLELFPQRSSFVIYRSSAGSGKTYTLTREYITLALNEARPRAFKRILAVTFTNKAMQEMKERIVSRLNAFSSGDLKDPMAVEIMEHLDMSAAVFRKKCGDLLSAILHEYSHFAVTTIDAFFQQVIRSFARELQVHGNYHLELDQDLIYKKVVESLMSELKENSKVRKWITQFSTAKLEDGGRWEIDRELVGFLKELDKDNFREFDPRLWKLSDEEITGLMESTGKQMGKYENKLVKIAAKADEILKRHGVHPSDLQRGAIHTIFTRILEGDFSYPLKKTQHDALNSGKWHKKKSEKETEIMNAVADGYEACLRQVADIMEMEYREYRTAQVIYWNIYLLALTNALLGKLQGFKKDHEMLFISDATVMLRELVNEVDAPFIYEKVGGFYENFLIDEFQDTSLFQWESFRPLIHNSLSEGNRNLIVGDVKQSIYRWRGGKLELLQSEAQEALSFFGVDVKDLDTNFRSTGRIISFNNAAFKALPLIVEEAVENTSIPFSEIYEQAGQRRPPSTPDDRGYVEINFLENENFKEKAMEKMLEILIHLQDCRVPLGETAILVRSNSEAKYIADFLLAYRAANPESPYSFEIVSSESLHLSTSPAVGCIIAALRMVDDPEDMLNESAVRRFMYELDSEGQTLETHLLGRINSKTESLKSKVDHLRRLPLYSLVERLIELLGLQEIEGELPYLLTFQDAVLAFSRTGKGDIAGLLERWDEVLHKESIRISTDIDAIRILTVHKVKGLEFHSVILPFAHWKFSPNVSTEWFRYDNGSREFLLPVRFSSTLKDTAFEQQYNDELTRRYLDNLNLIYVAFTRAIHDLWCITQRIDKPGNGRTSDFLNLLVGTSPVREMNQSDDNFTYGERDFKYAGKPPVEKDSMKLLKYESTDWHSLLTLKPAPRRIRDAQRNISISLGLIIHEILSEVRYTSDLQTVLDSARYTAGLDRDQFEHLIEKVRLAFENEEIRQWFDTGWEVKNETSVFMEGEEYRPDRVVMDGKRVLIIDYKTGVRKSADIRQMEKYVYLLSNMYSRPVEGRILYLDDLEVIYVK